MAIASTARDADGTSPQAGGLANEFVVVGTSHRLAPIHVRERLAHPETRARLLELARTQARLNEACVLVTCNRVECWGLAPAPPHEAVAERVASALSIDPEALRVLSGADAYLHAIRVAGGFDSAVWGEPQIAGQVRAALQTSVGTGEPVQLHSAVRKVVRAAQLVRARAGLGPESRGAAEAATDLLKKRLGARGGRVLVVGAGTVGRRAAACAAPFAAVTVADRNLDKAQRAVAGLGGRAVPLAEGLSKLPRFDAAIVALSAPEPLVTEAQLRRARGSRRGALLLIDLSFPRAVVATVDGVPGVQLLDVDGLARAEERAGPAPATAVAERAAREWAKALHREQRARRADAVVGQLRSRAEAIRRDELERARRRLTGNPAADVRVLDKLTDRLVNRLLHDPTEGLRASWAHDEAEEVDRAARRLFRLEVPP